MKPPRVLVLQHIRCETPGVYEELLDERDAAIHRVELDEGDFLPDWRAFEAIVAMGGPMEATDDRGFAWLRGERALIREAVEGGLPYWGVCLGAQLLACSLGSKLQPRAAPEVGLLPVDLTTEATEDPVFAGLPQRFMTLQWHSDTFELPVGAQHLGYSPVCPNQAFRIRNAYGLQFHLEISPTMIREWTEVPAYKRSLNDAAGLSATALLAATTNHVSELNTHARTLFERWFDHLVSGQE
jgi:GMP synthase (glutamine-hydrolysing)